MINNNKETLKRFLGGIPLTAELYWLVRQRDNPTHSRFSLKALHEALPSMVEEVKKIRPHSQVQKKKVFIFAALHYWIEQAAITGLGLAADNHDVTLGFYPYFDWFTDSTKFDIRRQNIYAQKVLEQASSVMDVVSFITYRAPYTPLPKALQDAVNQVTVFDTQYTLQIEDVDPNWPTYQFRLKRNQEAAQSLLAYLRATKPDVVIVPNGTVQEFGIVYRVARFLKIPVTTYEFSDQREAFWIAQNAEIMRQDTSEMWSAQADSKLSNEQLSRIKSLFESRQQAKVNENFTRQWQSLPSQGAETVREQLKLDNRPVVLLATNVLGDSLTLGRQVFSKTMADWVSRTILYFIGRPDIQLVIRIHPGEILTREYSMVDVVRQTLPELPEYIHVIQPEEKVNTYDLVEITDVGLVYTTTVGLEMALKGIPVVVAGQTHYRDRGFTFDPNSWVEYFKLLGMILEDPKQFKLSKEKIAIAWKYAYHFFYTFPLPFPWHIKVWQDYETHKLSHVFSKEGKKKYGNTFRYLVGEPLDWTKMNHNGRHA
ncbi:MAG: capsular polysaccharide export protein, LipB/KpsS family [Anaerolineaceae bacterium]